jgi:hypothetical protein
MEVKLNVYRVVGKRLPDELSGEIFTYILDAEAVPESSRITKDIRVPNNRVSAIMACDESIRALKRTPPSTACKLQRLVRNSFQIPERSGLLQAVLS